MILILMMIVFIHTVKSSFVKKVTITSVLPVGNINCLHFVFSNKYSHKNDALKAMVKHLQSPNFMMPEKS